MNRETVLALLSEILEVTRGDSISSISINADNNGNFSLKVDYTQDEHVLDCINPILVRDKLTSMRENGAIIIHSPK